MFLYLCFQNLYVVTVNELHKEILNIKERNKKVELEKAWETSMSRKALIFVLTYFVSVLVFIVTKIPKPFTNAVIPAIAFLLSTMSLSYMKKHWMKNAGK